MTTYKIVMLRHGESEWNEKNLFCGWYDSNLSAAGKREALSAGRALKNEGYKFDLAYTSMLTRAQDTLALALEELGQNDIPVTKTWRLNERHYGSLTGLNKSETAAKFGEAQVAIWRRSYDIPPPPMEPNHPYYDIISNDPRYSAGGPSKDAFPRFESLKLTIKRTLPFWNEEIIPQLRGGKSILIVAHGSSLRGIVKHLDNLSDVSIMGLNLPTGLPFAYILDQSMTPTPDGSLLFLRDATTIKEAKNTPGLGK